jgi:hypothetical protein
VAGEDEAGVVERPESRTRRSPGDVDAARFSDSVDPGGEEPSSRPPHPQTFRDQLY